MKEAAWQTDAEKAAEAGLIGLALTAPRRIPEIELEPEHFFSQRWAAAWTAIRELHEAGKGVDEISVADRMEAQGVPGMLAELTLATLGTIAHMPAEYVAIVREGWVTRQVRLALGAVEQAQRDGLGGVDLLSYAVEKLGSVQVEQPSQMLTIGQLVRGRFTQLRDLADAKGKGLVAVTGIPTLPGLDKIIGGLQRGICTVVAGRPGMGKSAFGMTLTDRASDMGLGVHVFSLEDTRDSYSDRALSRTSLVPADKLRACEIHAGQIQDLRAAADTLYQRKGWIVDDRSGITAEEVVRAVRRERNKNRTEIVVVDYIQLLRGPPSMPRSEASNKTAVTDHAMNVLADAAKQDGIAYIVLAQLNRECEKREDKRPLLSDLKQSGALEERAKAVIVLYRPAVYDDAEPADKIEIIVRKNNHGDTGIATARWHGPTTRID